MKFIGFIDSYTNANGFAVLRFPGAGVLKNLSFTIIQSPTEVLDQDNWRVVLGDANRSNLQNVSPLTDDAFEIMRSARDQNLVIIQGIDFQESTATASGTSNRHFFYHSGKTIRVRNDRDYLLGVFGKPASNFFKVLVQGEYYPYKNSYLKFKYLFDSVDDADNFQYGFIIPTGLKNAVLEYDVYVKDTEGTEIAARVSTRIIPWNQSNNLASSQLLTGTGIVDGAEDDTGDIIYGGTIEDFIIGTSASGLGSHQGVLPIRNILRPGDKIAFDITNYTGDITDAESFKMSITLHGRAIGEPVSTRSHFLDSNGVVQPVKEVFE